MTNVATLNGALTLRLNRTNIINASKLTAGTLVNASALTVTNVGPALLGGETFQLFDGAVTGFTAANLPALTGSWYWTNTLAVDGSIAVVNSIATYSTNITTTVSVSDLVITWPATHLGWMVEAQTNTLNVGLSTNWGTISNTAAQLGYTNAIDPANGAVFFRLRKP